MQYQAGYFLNGIFDLFLNKANKEKVEKIVFQLGHFDLDCNQDLKHTKVEYISEIKIVNNLMQRGLPALPSTFIADIFSTTFGKTKKQINSTNDISHPFIDELLCEEIYKAIHIIEPRITLESQKEGLDDEAKATGPKGKRYDFKYSFFPEFLGHSFLQLIEENRTFGSIIDSAGIDDTDSLCIEFEQIEKRPQDFVLEMPYAYNNEKGIALELDDTPSETSYDYEIDLLKQNLCKKIGWGKPLNIETQRTSEINNQLRPLIDFTYNEYFDTIAKNYRSPLYKSGDGLTALQYALSPIAVARIEKTILEYLLSGQLSLNDATWKIAIIERDVPCAHLALQDLMLNFENLFALKGEQKKLPEIKLNIYNTVEFRNAKLNEIYPGDIKLIDKFDEKLEFDLLIDISMLQRSGLITPSYTTKAKRVATIRSAKSISAKFSLLTDKSVPYLDFFSQKQEEKIKDKAKNALKYFLKNIFRKDSFLPGQLELINQSLQQKNTLGVFPSGGGKTIPSLLAAMLNPGVAFFVCPEPNLIANHILNLEKVRYKNTVSICDKTIPSDQISVNLKKLENSKAQLAFISPDYLRKLDLRLALSNMEYNKIFITCVIIDEAHCVSEWGHQFIPVYSKIGSIKDQIFKNAVRQPVTIVALSGTASYACISDICKEFHIEENQIVSPKIKQSNISFKVIDTTSKQSLAELNAEQIQQLISERKQVHFSTAIENIFQENTNKGALIFCQPEGSMGVSDMNGNSLSDKIQNNFPKLKLGTFKGGSYNKQIKSSLPDTKISIDNSAKFYKNELDVLVATSNYGIGTNKPNIRNIIYVSPPCSFEAFIQQTYRAGIDSAKSDCTIFVDKQEFSLSEKSSVLKYLKENKSTFDKNLAYEEVISKYKGIEKEKAILDQLWNGFKSESRSYAEIISSEIEENFQIDVDLIFQPEKNAQRIYCNIGSKTYGYIDLTNFTISTDESGFEKKLSKEILNYTANQVKKRIAEGDDIQKVISDPIQNNDSVGIAKVLDNMLAGSFSEINIPFVNDSVENIFKILSKKVSTSFTKKIIRKLYNLSFSDLDFINRLELFNPTGKTGNYKEEIIRLYNKGWNKDECELAIYRLGKIGFVEDYQINENNQLFLIKLRKENNNFYKNNLFSQFDAFLMPEIALEEKNLLTNIKELSPYQALMASVDFFYKYILTNRFNSIETLYSFLNQIPDNKKSTNELNLSVKDLLDRYFDAKYANGYFSLIPEAKPLTGNQQDFTMINGYLKLGPLKENWQHLLKSADTIAKIKPDDFIPYLLKAYTILVGGEKNEDAIDNAFDQIAQGFIKMRKSKNYDKDNYQTEIQSLLDILFKNRPDLKENYGQIIWLRMHYIWLKNFNQKNVSALI